MVLTFSRDDIPLGLRNKRILLVGEGAALRELHAAFLRRNGFNYVFEADNGLLAAEIVKVQPIDLIISDWQMAKLTGIELLATVRGNEHTAEIPFVMLTTRRDTSMVEKSLQKGATDYLIKPFKSAQLGMKVVMALACSDYMAPVQIDENLHILISEEEEALRKASGQ